MTDYNLRHFGTYHPACGRSLATHKLAGLEDPEYLKPHQNIEPVRSAIEGARAYAHHSGFEDPHNGSVNYHGIMTHAGLLRDLGHAYDRLPGNDPEAHKHFAAMRDEVRKQHDFMTHRMGIRSEFVDHDPYKNIHEMVKDVRDNKRIKVLGTHVTGPHGFFSDEDNNKFRAVHDVFGHAATGRAFDAHGEEGTYQAHSRMFSPLARGALATETRGQQGSLHLNGQFGAQRIAVLPKRLWHPGLAHAEAKVDWQEFHLLQHAQDTRYERAGNAGNKEDRDYYFGLGENLGEGKEHRVNPREWIQHSRQPGLKDQSPEFQENYRGYQLGRAHGRTGRVGHEELDREWRRSPHPDHFSEGYEEGLGETLNKTAYAVLVSGNDDMPTGMRVIAHVSGNSIDVLHCPFCGSGAVIARSDGTIECGYCTSVFTVQVQPAYPGFPQSVDGQPYQWPGMPDPNAVMAPDAPPGTNVNPLQDPMAADPMAAGGAPPLGDGGLLGVDGGGLPPQSSDPADGEDGDDEGDEGGNPFAKGGDDSKSDKKSDDKKSDKKPPSKKSSSLLLKTASGAQLDAAEFEAHLAMKYAQNPLVVAQLVRDARANGTL